MAAAKHSPKPLWLTLGFGIGLAFGRFAFGGAIKAKPPVLAEPNPPPPSAPARLSSLESPANAGTLAAVEQTFQRWGGYAVWENNLTEFAAWNPRLKKHADYYEAVRTADGFYFRTIPALTRPLIDHGLRGAMVLAFTEPQAEREKFYREHPGYDPATAPEVELPPKPPEPHEEWIRRIETRGGGVPPPPPTTPGDGTD